MSSTNRGAVRAVADAYYTSDEDATWIRLPLPHRSHDTIFADHPPTRKEHDMTDTTPTTTTTVAPEHTVWSILAMHKIDARKLVATIDDMDLLTELEKVNTSALLRPSIEGRLNKLKMREWRAERQVALRRRVVAEAVGEGGEEEGSAGARVEAQARKGEVAMPLSEADIQFNKELRALAAREGCRFCVMLDGPGGVKKRVIYIIAERDEHGVGSVDVRDPKKFADELLRVIEIVGNFKKTR